MPDITTLPKTPTGIAGLDEMLRGGIPEGRITLVQGVAGLGKTVLGSHFLFSGARSGEPGLLLSFEERAEFLRHNMLSLGWDFAALEKERKLAVLDPNIDPQTIVSGDFSFTGLLAMIDAQVSTLGIKRVVVDAVDVVLYVLGDPDRRRGEMYRLMNFLLERDLTVVLSSKDYGGGAPNAYSFLEFAADCVIRLEQPRGKQRGASRKLHVVKYRGSGFVRQPEPYTIAPGEGFVVSPVTRSEMSYPAALKPLSTGSETLDSFLSGGYRRGASAMLAGPTGIGKTIFSSIFARGACERGEKVLYFSLEESPDSLLASVRSAGVEMADCVQKDSLRLISSIPGAGGMEDHYHGQVRQIEDFGPDHVVVDSITPFLRLGGADALFDYTVRLLGSCRKRGITVIFTQQTTGVGLMHSLQDVGFVSLLDTLLFLNYNEIGGEVNRTLLVLKSRGVSHSNQYREFVIDNEGVHFFDLYVGTGGMMTGVARQEQEIREQVERRRREQEIVAKEREVERLRLAAEKQSAALQSDVQRAETELRILRFEEESALTARGQRGRMRRSQGAEARKRKPTPDSGGEGGEA